MSAPRFTKIEGPYAPKFYQGDTIEFHKADLTPNIRLQIFSPLPDREKYVDMPLGTGNIITHWITHDDFPTGWWVAKLMKNDEELTKAFFEIFEKEEPVDPVDSPKFTSVSPSPRYQDDTITFTKENVPANTRLQILSPLPERTIHLNMPMGTGNITTHWGTFPVTPAGWWIAKLVKNSTELAHVLFEIREKVVEADPTPQDKEFYVFSIGFESIISGWLYRLKDVSDPIKKVFENISGWEFEKAYKGEEKITVYAYKTSNNPAPAIVALLLIAGIASAFLVAGIILTSIKILRYTENWKEEEETVDEQERTEDEIIDDIRDCPELTDDEKQEIIEIIRPPVDPDEPVPVPDPDVPVPDIKNYKISFTISSLLPGFIPWWGLEKLDDRIIAAVNTVLSARAPGWSLHNIDRTENLLTVKLQKHGSIAIAALLPLILKKLKYILLLFGIAISGYVAKEMTEDWKEVKVREVEETLSRDDIIDAILEHPDLTEDQKAELIAKLIAQPEPEPEQPWFPGLPDLRPTTMLIVGVVIIIVILILLSKR